MAPHIPGTSPRYTTDASGNVYGETPPRSWGATIRGWVRALIASVGA